jgi:GntR family transcriptional regulator, arabinose operon transcriptional repressor
MKKYQQIYADLKRRIEERLVSDGDQLPTEAHIMEQYEVSRPTAAKAFRMLELEGLVVRSPGMGTFVRGSSGSGGRELLFGLAFPEFGHGEIFDPITSNIADLGKEGNFSLLWGTTKAKRSVFSAEELLDLFDEYISRKVDGVFFAPLEGPDDTRVASRKALDRLAKVGIPVVLIDRDLCLFPERSRYPLVGIDNARAGYTVTEHFLKQGETRVDFVWLPYEAYTVNLRQRGYRMALSERGIAPVGDWVHSGDPEDRRFVETIVDSGATNIICGNDETAALFMSTLRDFGVGIPESVRLAGFDDVRYSRLISVPLTTIRQPVREIAEQAVSYMLGLQSRQGEGAPTTAMVDADLIVRKSSIVPGKGTVDPKE